MKVRRYVKSFLKLLKKNAVLIAGTGICALLWLSGCTDTETVTFDIAESAQEELVTEEETEAAQVSAQATILVHVCGAVNDPGVYELTEGSRVYEAVEAAGGMAEGAAEDYLNLAGTVEDGQKVYVPYLDELESGEEYGEAQDSEDESSDGLININTADKEELMTLPGIGETKAEAIIAYREENGDFACIEDIMLVSGIKEGAYAKICGLITV